MSTASPTQDPVVLPHRGSDRAVEPVDGVSVVVPIHNEEDNLLRLHEELTAALVRLGKPYEILLVDDGSRDGSARRMEGLAARDPRVKLVMLRRNYGQTSALRAGMDRARFGAIVTIDGDLQNDPADIPAMVAKLEEGFDLVAGWRKDRQDSQLTRKLPSRLANRLIRRVTRVPIRDLGCTLKVIRREFLQELELYGDAGGCFTLQFEDRSFQIFAPAFDPREWHQLVALLSTRFPDCKADGWIGPTLFRWRKK